jgi:hypothetical protein
LTRIPTGWADSGFHTGNREEAHRIAEAKRERDKKYLGGIKGVLRTKYKVKKLGYRDYVVLERPRQFPYVDKRLRA